MEQGHIGPLPSCWVSLRLNTVLWESHSLLLASVSSMLFPQLFGN